MKQEILKKTLLLQRNRQRLDSRNNNLPNVYNLFLFSFFDSNLCNLQQWRKKYAICINNEKLYFLLVKSNCNRVLQSASSHIFFLCRCLHIKKSNRYYYKKKSFLFQVNLFQKYFHFNLNISLCAYCVFLFLVMMFTLNSIDI